MLLKSYRCYTKNYIIDDSIQFNKSIFEIDFSTEIYFKMGGEIEFIKIFNQEVKVNVNR